MENGSISERRDEKGVEKRVKIGEQGCFTIATEEQSPIPLLLSVRNSRKKARKWQALSVPRESLPSDACITVYCRSPRGRVLGITSFLSAFATATFLPSGYASRCSSLPDKMDLLLFDSLPLLFLELKTNHFFFPPPSFLRYPHFRKSNFLSSNHKSFLAISLFIISNLQRRIIFIVADDNDVVLRR